MESRNRENNHLKDIQVEREVWKKIGMTIDTIFISLITFAVRIIGHKVFQSSRLNSMSFMVMHLGYKIVKKAHTYDLVELQL